MVKGAAGCADHDMDSMFQGSELGTKGNAATQGQHLEVVGKARQPPQFPGHLVGKLPGGTKHQRLHAQVADLKVCQQADTKGGRLAATGLGPGDHVLARQDQRQAVSLDRCHRHISQGGQVLEHGGLQVK